jgi:hypothetical protein
MQSKRAMWGHLPLAGERSGAVSTDGDQQAAAGETADDKRD